VNGIEFYRGPSLLTGDPIVAVATGFLRPSLNPKTGPMIQTWILRSDLPPMDAVRINADAAVCGDCALRGDRGRERKCYVAPWTAPHAVFKHVGQYPAVSWEALRGWLTKRAVRLGAYGDPAALPFEIWRVLLSQATNWTGHTHAWRSCDLRLQAVLMASVDSVDSVADFQEARRRGWRTFRLRAVHETLVDDLEVVCPASDEGGHATTCARCALCRGGSMQARSIAIFPHGHNGTMAAFHRSRQQAEARA